MELQDLDMPARDEQGALAGLSNAAVDAIGKIDAHVVWS